MEYDTLTTEVYRAQHRVRHVDTDGLSTLAGLGSTEEVRGAGRDGAALGGTAGRGGGG